MRCISQNTSAGAHIAGENVSGIPPVKQQVCRRCLLSESTEEGLYRTVMEYVHSLPDERKVSLNEYERRLAICKGCDYLVNGMCSLCGCYVEVRAVKKDMYCAKSKEFW